MPAFHRLARQLALLLCATSACQPAPPATTSPPRLSQAQVLADLTLFQQIKEAAHPGIYKYHAKAQLDSAFTTARAQVTGPLTVLDEYRLLVQLTDYEGSLHNDTELPDSVERALRREAAFFPYPLKPVAGQLVLNSAHAPLPLGAVLTRLNGVPAARLLRELGKYYTTDGVNTTGKTVGLTKSFPLYYQFEYGPSTSFRVEYIDPTAQACRQQTVPAVPYAVYQRAFAQRHSRPSDQSFFDDSLPAYAFQVLPHRATAILRLNSFDIGEDDSPGHRRYARFLDSCFTAHLPSVTSL